MNPFDFSATYYDAFYRRKSYRRETEFVLRRLREHGAQFDSMLELGCGTGSYTEYLARYVDRVIGVELCPAMCRLARQKRRLLEEKRAQRIIYRSGDLRTFRSPERFSAVVALFHVLSYQTRQRDLDAAFRVACRQLNPEGLFLFDFWYGPGVENDLPVSRTRSLVIGGREVVRMATPTHFAHRHIVRVRYDFEVRSRAGSTIRRATENHDMRYLFASELEALCVRNGFELLELCEWLTGTPATKQSWSACVVARKRK